MRTARIDWTDQTVEYIDEEFEVAIPGEGGQFLSAGYFTLRMSLIGTADSFEPGATFTLEHNDIGTAVTFRFSTSYDPRRQPSEFGRLASAAIDRDWERIENWAVDEAHRIGLGERDPDDERDAWIERQGVDTTQFASAAE